ncbi:MAG TPA: hypothetical protein PLO37_11595 [Candidatus Hydrogenedentes bacterium]|nr:hypothetical protein [Candidatus Hydrogenedentota bacterium]HPG67484.1 hypothetical protein [Candidatus Hydrogenedentota bacterium]
MPADHAEHVDAKARLAEDLTNRLRATGDPRILGGDVPFDTYPYYGKRPKWADPG